MLAETLAAMQAALSGERLSKDAEASLLAADAYMGEAGVEQVVSLVRGARRTLSTIRRGIGLSLAYNVVGIGLAMAGWVSPLLAAVLMPLSSLSAVTNAYRSPSFGRNVSARPDHYNSPCLCRPPGKKREGLKPSLKTVRFCPRPQGRTTLDANRGPAQDGYRS